MEAQKNLNVTQKYYAEKTTMWGLLQHVKSSMVYSVAALGAALLLPALGITCLGLDECSLDYMISFRNLTSTCGLDVLLTMKTSLLGDISITNVILMETTV